MCVEIAVQEGEIGELADRAVVMLRITQRYADHPCRIPEDPLLTPLARFLRGIADELTLGRLARVGLRGRAGHEPDRVRQVAREHDEYRRDDAGCDRSPFNPTTDERRKGAIYRALTSLV